MTAIKKLETLVWKWIEPETSRDRPKKEMDFRKAERRKAKLRLGITGPAGSGKTYGALLIAQGLGGKTVLIDTENGSGDLYAASFSYDIGQISAPYTVQKYLSAIHDAEEADYEIIIIDSLSHAWNGEGGLLDMQGKIADSSRSGNSFAAWRQVTPWHNKLIDMMLNSKCHIIATMRSKTEYIQTENERGKTEIRKVGLAPVQREGMSFWGQVIDNAKEVIEHGEPEEILYAKSSLEIAYKIMSKKQETITSIKNKASIKAGANSKNTINQR